MPVLPYFSLGLLNKNALEMVWSGFKKSVQPRNYFSVKKSSRKTYFSKEKVDTFLKIALFKISERTYKSAFLLQ